MDHGQRSRFLKVSRGPAVFVLLLATCLITLSVAEGTENRFAPRSQDGGVDEQVNSGDAPWPMAGANPQRTSWVPDGPTGELAAEWAKPIEPYIPQKVQIIGAEGKVFVSTAKGLYALNANTGAQVWVYPTDMPLGHSPTYAGGVLYVGGFDRKLHAINAGNGTGLWQFSAGGGFHTNPLVVNGKVYAGNRDGYFYAINAQGSPQAGELAWKFQTGGPILFSAAYQDGVIYFTSNDSYAYALDAETGALIWKTKLNVRDFHSWWPVVYRDTLIIVAKTNFRGIAPGDCLGEGCTPTLKDDVFLNYDTVADGTLIAPLGQQPGDWVTGTPTLDLSKNNSAVGNLAATEYLEARQGWPDVHPRVFILDRATGDELTWDFDGDGKVDYAPINPIGAHGNGYPAVVGYDDVPYFFNQYRYSGAIAGGGPTGWQLGGPIVSLTAAPHPGQSNDFPIDEPVGLSAGGSQLYWNLCCDRFVGGVDISIPLSDLQTYDGSRQWRYVSGSGAPPPHGHNSMPEGYHVESVQYRWNPEDANYVWAHADNVGPTVYNGRLYLHRSNAVIALGPGAEGQTLPTAPTVPSSTPASRPDVILRSLLAQEVGKMIDAGHLRPGYWSAGRIDLRASQLAADPTDYFHNPAQTIYVLVRALPHLDPALRQVLTDYLQDEFESYPPYLYSHVGWQDGAAREPFATPPEVLPEMQDYPARSTPYGSFSGWKFNPFNFYALWKYADAGIGDPVEIFNNIDKTGSRRLLKPGEPDYPSDSYLMANPHVHNAYIAGYIGWLALEEMAGLPQSQDRQAELERLLALRSSTFTWDLTPNSGNPIVDRFYYGYLISWNFMYLVPELAGYLSVHAPDAVWQAVDVYQGMTPYWFVSRGDETVQGETDYNSLYHYHSLFQAKAMILREPYGELEKHLDVPAFAVGDLFYIDNLVATLEAPNVATFSHHLYLPLIGKVANQQWTLSAPTAAVPAEQSTTPAMPDVRSSTRSATLNDYPETINSFAVNVPLWSSIVLLGLLIVGVLSTLGLRHKL